MEFAILGTLLVTLLAIAMDFSRIFYAAIEVANAASTGVQYGMQSSTKWTDYTGMQNAATTDAANVSGMTATASEFCTCSDGTSVTCGSGGCSSKRVYLQVLTTATFNTLGTYPLIPSSVTLNGKAVMRVQ